MNEELLTLLQNNEKLSKTFLRHELARPKQYETIPSERAVRKNIELIAYEQPVISNSKSRGYRIARKIETLTEEEKTQELEEVDLTINELTSRITKLYKRLKPLKEWKAKAVYGGDDLWKEQD